MDPQPIFLSPSGPEVCRLHLLDLTLPSPVENLALDEALLDEVEAKGGHGILRFWESDRHFVVLGRSCGLTDDVHLAACEADGVPILRRASGGGTVVQGPGCLSYALVLPVDLHPRLATIRSSYRFILERMACALHRWEPMTTFRGVSDLAVGEMKISGNAQRRQRRTILCHGTFLHGMPPHVIDRYLKQPKRQPDYRANRPHEAFLRTMNAPPQALKQAIATVWQATSDRCPLPQMRLSRSIAEVMKRSHPPQEIV